MIGEPQPGLRRLQRDQGKTGIEGHTIQLRRADDPVAGFGSSGEPVARLAHVGGFVGQGTDTTIDHRRNSESENGRSHQGATRRIGFSGGQVVVPASEGRGRPGNRQGGGNQHVAITDDAKGRTPKLSGEALEQGGGEDHALCGRFASWHALPEHRHEHPGRNDIGPGGGPRAEHHPRAAPPSYLIRVHRIDRRRDGILQSEYDVRVQLVVQNRARRDGEWRDGDGEADQDRQGQQHSASEGQVRRKNNQASHDRERHSEGLLAQVEGEARQQAAQRGGGPSRGSDSLDSDANSREVDCQVGHVRQHVRPEQGALRPDGGEAGSEEGRAGVKECSGQDEEQPDDRDSADDCDQLAAVLPGKRFRIGGVFAD